MSDDFEEIPELPPDLTDDEQALLDEMPELTGDVGHTRRMFLGTTIAGSVGLFALDLLAQEAALAALASPDAVLATNPAVQNLVKVALKINGATKTLELDSRVVLLDALRERLAL